MRHHATFSTFVQVTSTSYGTPMRKFTNGLERALKLGKASLNSVCKAVAFEENDAVRTGVLKRKCVHKQVGESSEIKQHIYIIVHR